MSYRRTIFDAIPSGAVLDHVNHVNHVGHVTTGKIVRWRNATFKKKFKIYN